MTLQELRAKKQALSSKMTAAVDLTKVQNRLPSADEAKAFDADEAEFRSLTDHENRMRAAEQHATAMGALDPVPMHNINPVAQSSAANPPANGAVAYESAHAQWRRGGMERLSLPQRDLMMAGFLAENDPRMALTPATGAGGGYTVPQGFENKLTEALKFFGGISEFSQPLPTDTGNPLPFPTDNDTTNIGEIVGVNTQVSQAYPGFGQIMLGAITFSSKIVLIPFQLMQDSALISDDYLVRKLATRIGRIKNQKFTVGVGPTGSEPMGIVTAVAAAGNIYTLPPGNTAKFGPDDLVNLEHSVDPLYRPGSKYMFHDSTLRFIKTLKDNNGRPLWLPSLASGINGGFPATVNGYPYVINNDMPPLGAGNYFMIFGNPDNFVVRSINGSMMVRFGEKFMDFGQIGFLLYQRGDSNLIDAGTHPIAAMQNSAT